MQPCSEIMSQPGSTLNFSNARFLSDSADEQELSVSNVLQMIYTQSAGSQSDQEELQERLAPPVGMRIRKEPKPTQNLSLSTAPIPFDELSPVPTSNSFSRQSEISSRQNVAVYRSSNQITVLENEMMTLQHTGRLLSEGSEASQEILRLAEQVQLKPGDIISASHFKRNRVIQFDNILAGLELDSNEHSTSYSNMNIGKDN